MKKLLLIMSLVFMGLILSAQKKSNYEKYWQAKEDSLNKTTATAKPEYDDLYYQPSKDAKKVKKNKRIDVDQIVDTLVNDSPDIQVNYYYNDDPFYYSYNIGRFYHGGFNYWMYSSPWYYSNWMYDPYDFYWDMRFSGYPYWSYPYYNNFGYGYSTSWRNNHYNHWNHNYYNHNNHNNNQYNNHNHNSYTHNNEYKYTHQETSPKANRRTVQPQSKETNRTYSPSYNTSHMSTRPQYNNSRAITTTRGLFGRRTNASTQPRSYSPSNTQRSITPNTQRSTQSRSYSPPTRSYNNSSSRSNSNYNSGGVSRSSGSGSSRSSGGSSGRK
jgi:uncharacterized membrane protein YgcG